MIHFGHRGRLGKWWLLAGCGLLVASALTVLLSVLVPGRSHGNNAVVVAQALPPHAVAAGTPTPTSVDCLPGMPAAKCAYIATAQAPPPPPTPSGSPPPLPSISCGPNFFSTTTRQMLSARTGDPGVCLRASSGTEWILVASGWVTAPQSDASATATPGNASPSGGFVAVDYCAATDATCLDPNAPHSLTNFHASYPPTGSDRGPLQWMASVNGIANHRIYFSAAGCETFIVDTATLTWYPSDAGHPGPAFLSEPTRSGSSALQSSPPAPVATCGDGE